MEIFRRLPVRAADPSWPPFPEEEKHRYGALSDRFEVVDRLILPAFLKQDAMAGVAQHRYRRMKLYLMVGAALTTIFGAVQAAFGDVTWPGIVVAILGLATGAVANQYRRTQPLATYLSSRAKAEELRSTYFRYLSGIDGLDPIELERHVAAITYLRPVDGADG